MIRIKFDISLDASLVARWPFEDKTFFCRHGMVFKSPNKAWEIQIAHFRPETLFNVELDLRMRGAPHAGPKFLIEILGFMVDIHVHDIRHWNYDENRWYLPGEDQGWD